MAPSGYKQCSKCRETKPMDDFHRHKGMNDGREYQCRACCKVRNREWRAANLELSEAATRRWRDENPEHVIETERKYKKRNPEKLAAQGKIYRDRHPEKARAKAAVRNAVARGKIVKPTACEECGEAVENPRFLHAHHEDYSKPLSIEWLCMACHAERHTGRTPLAKRVRGEGGLTRSYAGKRG